MDKAAAAKAAALIDAASCGRLAEVQKLLSLGVNVDSENSGRTTPLMKAVSGNHPGIAKVLIAKGADVNHTNFYLNTPLIMACYHGHLELAQLLLAAGADLDAKDKDGTALDNARKRNEPACATLLEEWQSSSPGAIGVVTRTKISAPSPYASTQLGAHEWLRRAVRG